MSPVVRIARLFALLALILGGIAGHDVAMASGAMEKNYPDVHLAMAHHGMVDTCDGTDCDQPEPPCCVVGQCLIATIVAEDCDFLVAGAAEPEALPSPGRKAGIFRAPFRPPAAGLTAKALRLIDANQPKNGNPK